jgi:hypothetical protein
MAKLKYWGLGLNESAHVSYWKVQVNTKDLSIPLFNLFFIATSVFCFLWRMETLKSRPNKWISILDLFYFLQYSLLEYCKTTLRFVACFLNWSSDSILVSVIRMLHTLWPPFNIPFYSVSPIVFSFSVD